MTNTESPPDGSSTVEATTETSRHEQTTAPARARALAPDLARGLMLLLIALANGPWHLWNVDRGLLFAHPLGATGADLVAQLVSIIVIDHRSYPLFAALFGYGMWQLYRRQLAAGHDQKRARRLLHKRHAWMIAFGAVHAVLLWYGDVVGAYGLTGLLVTALIISRTDRTLWIWVAVLGGLVVLNALSTIGLGYLVAPFMQQAMDEMAASGQGGLLAIPSLAAIDNYPLSMAIRIGAWALVTPGQVLMLTVPLAVIIAILAARRGILEEPARHRPLLRRVTLGGVLIGWLGAVPTALHWLGLLGLTHDMDWTWSMWHAATGVCAGLGYCAVFALVAARISDRGAPGPISRGLAAVGKRSLTCYVAQSVLFIPVLSAWGLGLGQHLSSWQMAAYAVGTWLVTLVMAVLLDRAGRRGPLEWLLRRLTYGRPGTAAVGPTPVRNG
ncbi:DUF418 domain-containing protein [Microlunatus sp. Y2014]|uniref:DUF418 domain-containing protein n=1 Tax=Microlunatus sp. Y2014 TaxID=3418488 RepID=UPI003DA76DFD